MCHLLIICLLIVAVLLLVIFLLIVAVMLLVIFSLLLASAAAAASAPATATGFNLTFCTFWHLAWKTFRHPAEPKAAINASRLFIGSKVGWWVGETKKSVASLSTFLLDIITADRTFGAQIQFFKSFKLDSSARLCGPSAQQFLQSISSKYYPSSILWRDSNS